MRVENMQVRENACRFEKGETMTIRSMDDLGKILQPKIEKAIKNVAIHFSNELRGYIDKEIYENNK